MPGRVEMKYLHPMVRVSDVEESLRFYNLLGLKQLRRIDNEKGRFSLLFFAAPGDEDAQVELTWNWDEKGYDGGRNFAHLAYRAENIYESSQRLQEPRSDENPSALQSLIGLPYDVHYTEQTPYKTI